MGFNTVIRFFVTLSALSPILAFPTYDSASDIKLLQRRAGVPSMNGSALSMTGETGGDYPRAIRRQDGALLGIYAHFQDANTQLKVTESKDEGATWTDIGLIGDEETATNDLNNGFLFQLSNGRVLAAYRNHSREATGEYIQFNLHVSYSDDNGATWGFLSAIVEEPGPSNGYWEPFLRYKEDGATIQAYYSHENSGSDQDSLQQTSTDDGSTWGQLITWSGLDVEARDGMIGVVSVDGVNLIAVFETTEDGPFHIYAMDSHDDGANWENRRVIYAPADIAKNAGAPQITNIGGTLVVSFMSNEDDPNNTWGSADGFGAQCKIITSTDGGVTWGNEFSVFDIESDWSGQLQLSDTEVMVMANFNGDATAQKVIIS